MKRYFVSAACMSRKHEMVRNMLMFQGTSTLHQHTKVSYIRNILAG